MKVWTILLTNGATVVINETRRVVVAEKDHGIQVDEISKGGSVRKYRFYPWTSIIWAEWMLSV